jgi:predicted nucleotidyltransferase
MIIGGQAVLVYGIPRLTEDIDITLGVGIEAFPKVLGLCPKLGLQKDEKIDDEFVKKTNVLVCKEPKTGIRVDFIFSFLDYERQAIGRANNVNIKGYKVKFASCEDLIIHKIFAGRARDLEDVKNLVSKAKDSLDIEYIKRWLAEFSKVPEFAEILQIFERILLE